MGIRGDEVYVVENDGIVWKMTFFLVDGKAMLP